MKLQSVARGMKKNIEEVHDDAFSQKMMGDGVAIVPIEGKIYAPASGEVVMVFPTYHAIGLKLDCGVEILIHIGIDTVDMNGDGFSSFVNQGDIVTCGDLLISFDIEKIKKAGYESDIMIIVTNTSQYNQIKSTEAVSLEVGDVLLEIE